MFGAEGWFRFSNLNKISHQRLIVFLVVLVSQLSITEGNRGFNWLG